MLDLIGPKREADVKPVVSEGPPSCEKVTETFKVFRPKQMDQKAVFWPKQAIYYPGLLNMDLHSTFSATVDLNMGPVDTLVSSRV